MDSDRDSAIATPGAHHFPCPACGADLRFDPATGALRCGHCGHADPLGAPANPWRAAAAEPVEQHFAAALATDLPGDAYDETRLRAALRRACALE